MYKYSRRALFLIPCLWANWVLSSTNVVHHQLTVTLKPSSGYIHVIDTITLPENSDYDSFILNDRLSLKNTSTHKISPNILSVKNIPASSDQAFGAKQYFFNKTPKKLTVEYSGKIVSSLVHEDAEFSLNMRDSAGIISQEGVYLTRASIWYPVFSDELISFNLDVQLPKNWHSVSQGVRTSSKSRMQNWHETQPQDELYLLAAKYQVYSEQQEGIEALVFLKQKDDPLATTYIDSTFYYIAMYNNLLGPYPYGKFAMVENFWETGFGMPSFTLLGPRVLRFPFILYTSYPHEILHNWWANGVFVDYKQGNWAEGLTSYLADHLLKEQRHLGHQYRRDVLQKYNDYVTDATDIPLNKFYARHNSALEAIGYGKTLMMFHMLRIKLGDPTFIQSLKNLYREQLFKLTSYDDIRQTFEKTSSLDLSTFFKQWISRTGAPALSIKDYAVNPITHKSNTKYELTLTLKQQQNEHPYELDIPIALSLETATMAQQTILKMTQREQTFKIALAHKPLNFRIDPQFDIFRQVDSSEIPPALSQGFGAEQVSIILPKKSSATLLTHYQSLAEKWSQTQPGQWQVLVDSEIKDLPTEGAVWIVGWKNKYTAHFKSLIGKNVSWNQKNIIINGKTYATAKHSFILSTRDKQKPQQTLLWLATTNVHAIPGLIRKLPHYRKYSYLAFLGSAPTNVAKGQWDTLTSPLIRVLDPQASFATLASRNALIH